VYHFQVIHSSHNGQFESDIIATTKTHRRCHVWCAETWCRIDNV